MPKERWRFFLLFGGVGLKLEEGRGVWQTTMGLLVSCSN